MLYTTMPSETVWEGFGSARNYQQIEMSGRTIIVETSGWLSGTVVRLLSTNPADYLDPRWQPGSRVHFV